MAAPALTFKQQAKVCELQVVLLAVNVTNVFAEQLKKQQNALVLYEFYCLLFCITRQNPLMQPLLIPYLCLAKLNDF